jgi:hypothetical protein
MQRGGFGCWHALTGYVREELIGRTSVEIGLIAEDSLRGRVIEQIDRG